MFSRFFGFFAFVVAVVGVLGVAQFGSAQEPKKGAPAPKKEAKNYDETILAHFKRQSDTASLLAYLKDHSAADDDLLAIPELIKQLGSERYNQRQAASKKLLALGLPAFMPLLADMNDRDPERAELVKSAIEKMDRGTHTIAVPPVAIRMLMKRKPPELLEVLLRYLPYTTDPEVEEDLYYDIDELAVVGGKISPLLVKALDDKLPARRALAGCIVARVGTTEQKQAARKLLKDADANVRLRTAQGFLAGLEKAGIPTLIELLDGKPVSNAWQAEELLIWMAGDAAPKELVWSGGEKAKTAKAAWEKWWKDNEAMVDLPKVVKLGNQPRFYKTLGRGCLVGGDGKARWKFEYSPGVTRFFLVPIDRVYDMEPISAGVNEKLDKFVSEFAFHERTLDGKLVRTIKWQDHDQFIAGRNVLSPNGMLRTSDANVIVSFGLEGQILPRVDTGKSTGFTGGAAASYTLGYSDGLAWVHVGRRDISKRPYPIIEEQLILLDPMDGKVVNRWDIADYKELANLQVWYPAPRGQFLFWTDRALWSFENGKLHLINNDGNLRPAEEKGKFYHEIKDIYPLRGSGFVTFNGAEIACYSRDWMVRRKVKSQELIVLHTIEFPFALVSFGFH